jgi:hypothetical protein
MFNIKRPIEYLIYLGVPLLVYYFSNQRSLFFSILTVDSMLSAINFIRSFLFRGLSDAKIVYDSNCVYEVPNLRRYIYYLAIVLIYNLMCNLLWTDKLGLLKFILFITVSPPILKIMTDRFLRPFFQHIEYEQRRLVKNIICQQLANFINFFAFNYLQETTAIKSKDFTKVFIGYDKAVDTSLNLLKNIVITSVIRFSKSKITKNQFKIIKTIYKFKTGNSIGNFSTDNPEEIVRTVLQHHQWNRLLDHDVCNAIIKIYQQQDDNFNIWTIITEQLHYKILALCSVSTIASFGNRYYLIFIFNLLIRWLRKGKNIITDSENIIKIIIVIIGTFIGYYFNSFLLGSFCAEFGYILGVNKVTISVKNQFLSRCHKIVKILHHDNKYTIFLLFTMIYLYFVGFFESYNFYLSVVNVVYLCFNLDDDIKKIMVGFLTFTCLFSYFHYLHLIHNTYICYLIYNIIHHLKNKNDLNYHIPISSSSSNMLEISNDSFCENDTIDDPINLTEIIKDNYF